MTALIWRIIIAIVAFLFAVTVIPLIARILGLPLDGDIWLLLRLCLAGLAIFYIIKGPPFPAA